MRYGGEREGSIGGRERERLEKIGQAVVQQGFHSLKYSCSINEVRGQRETEGGGGGGNGFGREQYKKGTLSLIFISNIWLSSGTLPVV